MFQERKRLPVVLSTGSSRVRMKRSSLGIAGEAAPMPAASTPAARSEMMAASPSLTKRLSAGLSTTRRNQTIDNRMPGIAKKMNISFQPQIDTIAAPRMGVTTGPNLTADRKMPEAVPFSFEGNQWLIVVVTPIGNGPSATPRPRRHIFRDASDPTSPVSAVATDVRIIEIVNTLRTPKRDSNQAEGNCAKA